MRDFIEKHQDHLRGTLYGFDRVIFWGEPKTLSYTDGLESFLASRGLRYSQFKSFFETTTERLIEHIEALTSQQGRPYEWLTSPSASKDERARAIAERDGVEAGLVCCLGALEPCRTVRIQRNRRGKPRLTFTKRQCKHLYLYFIDPDFGWMHIRIQTWIPFSVQIYINGRSFLAQQLDQLGVAYERDNNCFLEVADLTIAQAQLERLPRWDWIRQLDEWVEDALQPVLQLLRGYKYFWTVRQSEHALDVMFNDDHTLAATYPSLADHAIRHFRAEDVLRFLGHRRADLFKGQTHSRWADRREGVRVRHTVERNSIKMYDKADSVLRIETTINNPHAIRVMRPRKSTGKMERQPLRKGVCDIFRRHEAAYAANQRYLNALAVVGNESAASEVLDPVSEPVVRRGRRYRALRPIGPDDARFLSVLADARFALQGFRNQDLRAHLYPECNDKALGRRNSARVTRYLALLRAHGLIRRIPRSHRYKLTKKGHMVIATAMAARDAPALAA